MSMGLSRDPSFWDSNCMQDIMEDKLIAVRILSRSTFTLKILLVERDLRLDSSGRY